jgi:hypothetical protein
MIFSLCSSCCDLHALTQQRSAARISFAVAVFFCSFSRLGGAATYDLHGKSPWAHRDAAGQRIDRQVGVGML